MKSFEGRSFNQLYHQILAHVLERGVKRFDSVEVRDLGFTLSNPTNRFVWNSIRNTNYAFAMKFFLWMLSGSDDYEYLYADNKNAERFDDAPEGVPKSFSTAYGPRIAEQLQHVIDELCETPKTRRANLQILNAQDQEVMVAKRGNEDEVKTEYPCIDTIFYSITPHADGPERTLFLDCTVTVRSNNVATTICYDVFNATMLQEYVYQRIQSYIATVAYEEGDNVRSAWDGWTLQLGEYSHYMVSAHVLNHELGLAEEILEGRNTVGMHRRDNE